MQSTHFDFFFIITRGQEALHIHIIILTLEKTEKKKRKEGRKINFKANSKHYVFSTFFGFSLYQEIYILFQVIYKMLCQ